MKFLRSEVSAFNRFGRPFTIPLDGQGIVVVEGVNLDGGDSTNSNGAGKTMAVVETLLWCLFGRMARYGDKQVAEAAVHPRQGADVNIVLETAGERFSVRRTRGPKGSPSFKILRESGEPFPVSRDPNKRGEDVAAFLGFDYNAFRYAVVVQGGTSFASADFASQMSVLEAILRMDELSTAADLARQQSLTAERALAVARAQATTAQRAYEQVEALADQLEDPIVEADANKTLEKLAEGIQHATWAGGVLKGLAETVQGSKEQMTRHKQAAMNAGAAVSPLLKEKERLEKSLGKLVCSACQRPFGTPAEAEKAQKKAEKRIKEIDAEVSKAYGVKQAEDTKAQQLGVRLYAQEQELRDRQRQADTVTSLVAQRQQVEDGIAARRKQRKAVDASLEQVRAEWEGAQEEATVAEAVHWTKQFWVQGYGRDGLQAELFAAAAPVLNHAAARYSQALTNNLTTVQFNPVRGSKREDLVRISGQSAQTYEGLSSGEKQRVNLILAWSLRALARWRLPAPLNFGVYDEVFDNVDEAGLRVIVRLLQEEAAAGGTVFVVTHNPALKALMPGARVLRVTRKNNESSVEYAA